MAYAGFRYGSPPTRRLGTDYIMNRFAEKLLKAAAGEKGIVEPTYIYLPGVAGGEEIHKETGIDFFSVPVELGVSLVSWFLVRS
jgi:malate dehydrogenase